MGWLKRLGNASSGKVVVEEGQKVAEAPAEERSSFSERL